MDDVLAGEKLNTVVKCANSIQCTKENNETKQS